MSSLTEPLHSTDQLESLGVPVGLFHTWWRGNPLPVFSDFPGLAIGQTDDVLLIATMSGIDVGLIWERFRRNHQPWLARVEGEPVAYGWSAAGDLSIGELGLAVELEPTSRYLWDFQTLPPWRGQGIYPRILQAMIDREATADRFWVGHDLDNIASAQGIAKAGFCQVGAVYRQADGGLALAPNGSIDHAAAACSQFGIRLVNQMTALER
jgi:GNAT superfamily N-acetyltransferase